MLGIDVPSDTEEESSLELQVAPELPRERFPPVEDSDDCDLEEDDAAQLIGPG